jgi:hypothetical protein
MINFAKISGPKAADMKEDCRRFHTEELSNFQPSTNIRLLKSRKSSGWGRLARMVEKCIEGFGGGHLME